MLINVELRGGSQLERSVCFTEAVVPSFHGIMTKYLPFEMPVITSDGQCRAAFELIVDGNWRQMYYGAVEYEIYKASCTELFLAFDLIDVPFSTKSGDRWKAQSTWKNLCFHGW